MRHLAVIGTAGRDRTSPYSLELWHRMRADLARRVEPDDVLVSGGAAWSDHLAVDAFLAGQVAGLELYLPAPLLTEGRTSPVFIGGRGTSGSAANYYHARFSALTRKDSIREIEWAILKGAYATFEPVQHGYTAMMKRNRKVAERCSELVAYTFGDGDEPDDGGTGHTWELTVLMGKKCTHVNLEGLTERAEL